MIRYYINTIHGRKKLLRIILPVIFLYTSVADLKGQEPPPRPVKVTVTGQSLSFGAFTLGAAGGTVTISSLGFRSATGDVILLNLGYIYSTALYQLEANPGTVISLLNGPDVTLTRAGGGSMTLHIGDSDPASPFVIATVPPATTPLNVGGILTVGNLAANPPGSYTGSFEITFLQE